MSHPCGCPGWAVISDPKRHAAWHALCVEQGMPPGPVNVDTTTAARGLGGDVGLGKGKRR